MVSWRGMRVVFSVLLLMAGVLGVAYLSSLDLNLEAITLSLRQFSLPVSFFTPVDRTETPIPLPPTARLAQQGTPVIPLFPPVVITPPATSIFAERPSCDCTTGQ